MAEVAMTALGVIPDREPHQKGRCMPRKSGLVHPTALAVAFIATANWITSGNNAWTLPFRRAGRPCRKDRRKAAGEFSLSAATTTRCVRSSVQHGDCEPGSY